jgi:hypothetical protein
MDWSSYKNIPFQERDRCMICGALLRRPLLEFPAMPLTEIFTDRKMDGNLGVLDQELFYCGRCGHAQLKRVVDAEFLYAKPSAYAFRTSRSLTGRQTTDFFINFMSGAAGAGKFKTLVEVGCNDAYLLSAIKDRAGRLVGVDPVLKNLKTDICDEKITLIPELFENAEIGGKIDAVICKDVLEHAADPAGMLSSLLRKAEDGAWFFVQVPLLDTLAGAGRFDQIFHQHLNYFSVRSFNWMLRRLNCEPTGFTVNREHWGSGLFAFRKAKKNMSAPPGGEHLSAAVIRKRHSLFRKNMALTNEIVMSMPDKSVYGYGAGLMLPILAYHMGNDFSCLRGIVDDDPDKDGKYYLQLPVPVVSGSKAGDLSSSAVLLTAISSRINVKRILIKLFDLGVRAIIYPLREI